MSGHGWIVIPHWEEYQHPDAARSGVPPWIKTYTRLLSDDAYLDLSLSQRGTLSGIWLEYARSRRRLPADTLSLSRRLGAQITRKTLAALENAGFIEISASRPASEPASRPASRPASLEREGERDKAYIDTDLTTVPASNGIAAAKVGFIPDLGSYTGARRITGSHGETVVRDPLGRDRVPFDWPYPRPTPAEIRAALDRLTDETLEEF